MSLQSTLVANDQGGAGMQGILSVVVAVTMGTGLLLVVLAIRHTRRSEQEEKDFLMHASLRKPVLPYSEERLQRLPTPVSNWLRLSGALESERPIRYVTIQQAGLLRTKPEGKWMPFTARQHASPNLPSFLWKARIQAAPGVIIYGKDVYLNGRAHMLIALMGLWKAGHAKGREIDQGSLVRYLAEIVWYPSAALSPHITWEALDDDKARAIIAYGGITASGVFSFLPTGEPVRFVAQRYKEAGGICTLEEWSVRMRAWKTFQGILLPSQGEVNWNLQAGPFCWLRFEVTDARFDPERD